MYAGKICEMSDSEKLYQSPQHPYSRILLEAIPAIGKFKNDQINRMDTRKVNISGFQDHGCRFKRRCFRAKKRCKDEEPVLKLITPGSYAACHYPLMGHHS
jgi:peptide/nickel transport system ATP-binding protein